MNTATEPQVRFIKNLETDRDVSGDEAQQALELSRALWRAGAFSKEAASTLIDVLKQQPRLESVSGTITTPASEGMHRLNGVIYKVQRALYGSGNLYAKRLVLEEPDCGGCQNGEYCEVPCQWSASFEYAQGAIKELSETTKMTLEQAKEWGVLYGTCCVCGRTLTNEDSIAAGIGPICAGRF